MKKTLKRTPYRYQVKGVKEIVRKFDYRALLADDMGLGKTPQALWSLCWLEKKLGYKPTVVAISPSTVKENWKNEILTYIKRVGHVLEGRKPPKDFKVKKGGFYVLNYDILGDVRKTRGTWLRQLRSIKPDLVIIDEVQKIKNPQAARTKSVRELCRGVDHIIALGGTGGVENRPAELFPILNILRPDKFPSFFVFAQRYCEPRKAPWGWEFKGATNLDELHKLLKKTCMIRRRKVDVLTDLPPKTKTVIPMPIENPKEYALAEKDFIQWLEKYHRSKAKSARKAERLVKMGYMKRLAGVLKLKYLREWIEEFLEAAPNEKLIFFAIHKAVLRPLHEHFKGSVLVDGSVTGKKRYESIERFNKNKSCRLFFGNINAAGEGWSCPAASTVAFGELEWKPTAHTQAEDRIHGIGRGVANKGANIYYLVAKNTIEEDLCNVIQVKQERLDTILDGGVKSGSFDVLSSVEKLIMRRKK